MLTATRVDRYDLLSPIGTGGMGRVYRARMEGLGGAAKHVALKLMHAHLAEDEEFVLLFLDEMRVAMALSHRNIVQTFDAGKAGDHYFMVMELVEGCSASQLLTRWPQGEDFPLDVALFIGMEVSAALDYAHRFRPEPDHPAGVLHRDVSPGNILLSAEGDVKLADFGVAKAAGGRHVTSANLIRGKLQYMAPEQAAGQAAPRSDLFALGAVIYELVTGQPIPRPSAFEGLQHAALPPAPSRLRPDVPAALDALILRCLEPDPARRLPAAGELRSTLSSVSFALQQRRRRSVDPHARLSAVLAQLGLSARGPAPAPAPTAARLARAVLDEVRAVPTDPELAALSGDGAASAAEAATLPAEPTSRARSGTAGTDVPPDRPPRRRVLARAALLAILLGGSVGGWYWWSTLPGPSAPPPVPAPPRRAAAPPQRAASTSPPADAAVVPDLRGQRTRAGDTGTLDAPAPQRTASRGGHGFLDINAVPWARVYIDGRFRGETPLQRLRLRARVYTVRLVNPGRRLALTQRIRVIAGRRTSKVFRLTKDPAASADD